MEAVCAGGEGAKSPSEGLRNWGGGVRPPPKKAWRVRAVTGGGGAGATEESEFGEKRRWEEFVLMEKWGIPPKRGSEIGEGASGEPPDLRNLGRGPLGDPPACRERGGVPERGRAERFALVKKRRIRPKTGSEIGEGAPGGAQKWGGGVRWGTPKNVGGPLGDPQTPKIGEGSLRGGRSNWF